MLFEICIFKFSNFYLMVLRGCHTQCVPVEDRGCFQLVCSFHSDF